MYKILTISIFLLATCATKTTDYKKAENAFDAGREFIDAGFKGDFTKATFFMLPNKANKQLLGTLETQYRSKDKEGRQQARTASINIIQVDDIDSITTIIQYSSSFEKLTKKIKVVKKEANWLVDYQYSFSSK